MELGKEIEHFYRQSLESDLEMISKTAMPTGHGTGGGSCLVGVIHSPKAHPHQGGKLTVRLHEDYFQVQRIIFKPLNIKKIAEDREAVLRPEIERELERKGTPPNPRAPDYILQLACDRDPVIKHITASKEAEAAKKVPEAHSRLHDAFHEYSQEGPVFPLEIELVLPVDGKPLSLEHCPIIGHHGVSYVHEDYLNTPQLKEWVTLGYIRGSDGFVDHRWPEEIEIMEEGAAQVYRRGDLARKDRRRVPAEPATPGQKLPSVLIERIRGQWPPAVKAKDKSGKGESMTYYRAES